MEVFPRGAAASAGIRGLESLVCPLRGEPKTKSAQETFYWLGRLKTQKLTETSNIFIEQILATKQNETQDNKKNAC